MISFGGAGSGGDSRVLEALGRSLALIEFTPAGIVISANENFCKTLGYSEAEIKGKHHSLFVDPAYARSADYTAFWTKLGRGEFDAREYKRIGKGGREVWIQASYNPVLNSRGAVVKVVKAATDVTQEKLRNAEFESKLNAVSRVQAVIEFTPGGEIITANENFLTTLGYRLEEIRGQHHRMFVESGVAQSQDYLDFWNKLNRGEFIAQEFKRIGKGGKAVWIQASYNPVFDMNGAVTKVVKFATDVTERVAAVNDIAEGLARLSNRDLEASITRTFPPAFEKVRQDFNSTTQSLRSTFQQMIGNVTQIRSGAVELSTSSDDLSRRTEQQAASLEETAAALDEITATVRKSAEGATHAREVVATADADAKKSAVIVRQAIEAMDAISKSSNQIGQIIGVIDEIAFQTNLLALNAGVEAARAGDAGRGFAVVASEVRALAQRSADAAKEIKGLISVSTTQVGSGVKLVAETGGSLERILTQVTEINSVMTGIAAGAQEQSVALGQVNAAINQMDQVTQQNAAMVEESTAATHSLSQEADSLSQLVGAFKTGLAESTPHRPASSRPAPPRPANTVRALKTGSRGGAAVRKPETSVDDGWNEF
ncbi:MAG: PAS domain-containing methyl-accepting chemotaxis protein [Hyphomonadaceae bacterium]|nr:MAG: methyl-accepting chemotaxis protein [Caulobacteraceae bacterium]MBT9444275.1 PAS domain-containing methyl-accepting chemotaxis protein [Hyphomonadaceae bacterium]TPW03518.1 MAG: methyl-accepting chemotaxis protein [Alphaproteobacteria bacterium]